MTTTHKEWFNSLVGGDSINAAAKKVGVHQASLNRQVNAGSIPAEIVIKLGRAYVGNPVQALVDTGYLNAEEAGENVTHINWETATDGQIALEMLRRADPTGLLSRPLDTEGIRAIQDLER